MPCVVVAREDDAGALSAVIAAAFLDLPPSRWLIADETGRRKIFPSYFGFYIEHVLACGTVHTTEERDAAALWLPVHGDLPPQPVGYLRRLAAITSPWTSRFLAFDAVLDANHPAGWPHQYLAMLAVRPDRQRHGIGTALLHARHAELDRQGQAAYLEASSQSSRDLYLRHGYRVRSSGPFHLPGDGPPMWPMSRPQR
jgi:ribosomal protein S18 acetylase RimI-like enzyme